MAVGNSRTGKPVATGYLVLVFLAGVVVCAVFFSLGFLVGYNERSSKAVPETDQVAGTETTPPPVVNPRAEKPSGSKDEPRPAIGGEGSGEQLSSRNLATGTPREGAGLPTGASAADQLATSSEGVRRPSQFSRPDSIKEKHAGFTVQVTASHTKQDAQVLVSMLRRHGYPAALLMPDHRRATDNLFRVQVGPFASRSQAEKVRARLAKEGLFKDLFITH